MTDTHQLLSFLKIFKLVQSNVFHLLHIYLFSVSSPCPISFTFDVSLACLHCHTETNTNEIILENHTFHLIIKSQLLSSFYGSCGKQCYPGKPSIKVIDEDTEHLKIWVTLKRRKTAEVRLARRCPSALHSTG